MHRPLLILLVVLGLVLVGGVVWWWYHQDDVKNVIQGKNTNTVTNTTSNTNTIVNATLPTEVKGDTAVTGKLTVNGVAVTISSFSKVGTFEGTQAEAGKIFVVLYIDAVKSADVISVKNGLQADAHLITNLETLPLASLKIASDTVSNDRGYMRFTASDKATGLVLEVGSGSTAQRVELPK